ncbi:MAG: DMT family transporter [Alphaproteobacteria bacterium]|nr:DMT family transporter [Alphaproteobacteria bacterium]MBM3733741.1 DMT family transporter [Acidimicrobiia bacterium]
MGLRFRSWYASKAGGSLGRGFSLMVVSGIAAIVTNAGIHHVATELHPFVVTFFRNLIGVVFLFPLLVRTGIAGLKPNRPGLQLTRGLLQAVSAFLFVAGLALAPLAKVTALNFTAPLFASVLAVAFLGETVRLRRTVALTIGFSGTLVVLRPWEIAFDPGSTYILLSAFLWAIGMIVVKILMRSESSLTTTILTSVISTPFVFIGALLFWQTPTPEQLLWLAGIGFAYAVSSLAFAEALKQAELTALMPLDFLKLIWAAILGFVIFAEVPETAIWIGGALIFTAATYIAYRERAARTAAPPPT